MPSLHRTTFALCLCVSTAHAQDAGTPAPRLTPCADINGDGLDDIVSGAPMRNMQRGQLYVYLGARPNVHHGAPSQTLNAPRDARRMFGSTVRYLGDLNGDHFCDVAVLSEENPNHTARVHVLFGSRNGLENPTRLQGIRFPISSTRMFPLGDTDHDGFADVLFVTGERTNTYTQLHGAATAAAFRVSTLSALPSGISDVSFRAYDHAIADFNNDRTPDTITVGEERITVQLGGTPTPRRRRVEFIDSLLAVGDFNGDGFDDVAVGRSVFAAQPDRTQVLYGSATGLTARLFQLRSRYGETAP